MRLLTLTLFGLLTISCVNQPAGNAPISKGATMMYSVGTQAEMDSANQRINQFKQELLRQGFHDESHSVSDTSDEFILTGQYGTLTDLRVTLRTGKRLQSEPPPLAGGVHAFVKDDQADREFKELYKKVCSVVTGQAEACTSDGS
jgi:thioredoxin reductase